jgi:Domain of unknown function (DUF1844)
MSDEDNSEKEMDQEEVQKEMAKMLTNVKDMTLYNLSVLASQAWHHLGLVPIPGVESSELDLEQAKMAIDLLEANLKVMSSHLEKDVDKQFKQVLMDLQLNFVNKSK